MKTKIYGLILLIIIVFKVESQSKRFTLHTIAFYNFENLFDTINDPNNDEEWTPNGIQNWTSKKYHQKIHNLARVIAEIGTAENPNPPTLMGGSEIENRGVLEDLIKEPILIKSDYGIVHFDSPDRRGIEVALLYQKKHFQPTNYINIPLLIYYKSVTEKTIDNKETEEDKTDTDKLEVGKGYRIYTRDILLVTGFLDGEELNIIVNHWPSRSGGEKKSSLFREEAGRLVRKIMDSVYRKNPEAKIITMGDLNDGAYNKSVKEGIGAKAKKLEVPQFGVYNPFEEMAKKGNASLFYRDAGDIFDQIMVSETLIQKEYFSFKYWKAGIYNKPFMIQTSGQYKGYPLRHSALEVGFSDHFPVYIYLIKEVN